MNMTKHMQKVFSKIAAFSLAVSLASPIAAADTDLQVTGNGAFSANNVDVEQEQQTTVVQTNTAVVTNAISADSSTGGNDASFNTGGDVTIWTGDASTSVAVENLLNKNVAQVECCDLGDLDVLIDGNGAYSENDAAVTSEENSTELFQDNTAVVSNTVDANAKTGGNDTAFNTGGDTVVKTGNADTTVELLTAANANEANVGGQGGSAGDISLRILGNGAFSENDITVELEKQTLLAQSNVADVANSVTAYAKTGWNSSDFNTGGDNVILTGNAETDVSIANWLNFNAADVDCGGCLYGDLWAKIGGNGAYSESDVSTDLDKSLEVFQDNLGVLANYVDGNAKTGHNDSAYGTGDQDGDPLIRTGNADSWVEVSNVSDANLYGVAVWDVPSFEWDWNWNWLSL